MCKLVTLIIGVFLMLVTLVTNAEEKSQKVNNIIVYQDPVVGSKVIATLPQGQALIPIFSQNDWVKVANPQNGDVGWVPKTSLTNATTVTITQQTPGLREFVITEQGKNGSATNIYRVIQYSDKNQLNPQQVQAVFNQIQAQQRKVQEDFNRMINDAFRSIGQPLMIDVMPKNFPVLPPVIIIQQPEKPQISPPQSAVTPKTEDKNKR